jgi:hypothetical protein
MASLIEFGALIRSSDSALTAFLGILGRWLVPALVVAFVRDHPAHSCRLYILEPAAGSIVPSRRRKRSPHANSRRGTERSKLGPGSGTARNRRCCVQLSKRWGVGVLPPRSEALALYRTRPHTAIGALFFGGKNFSAGYESAVLRRKEFPLTERLRKPASRGGADRRQSLVFAVPMLSLSLFASA